MALMTLAFMVWSRVKMHAGELRSFPQAVLTRPKLRIRTSPTSLWTTTWLHGLTAGRRRHSAERLDAGFFQARNTCQR